MYTVYRSQESKAKKKSKKQSGKEFFLKEEMSLNRIEKEFF